MNKFAETFRQYRRQHRVTLQSIANLVGKSVGYISDIEQGRRMPPDSQVVKKIERILSVGSGQLVKLAEQVRASRPNDIAKKIAKRPELQAAMLRIESMTDEQIRQQLKDWENSGGNDGA